VKSVAIQDDEAEIPRIPACGGDLDIMGCIKPSSLNPVSS
jgi:hypothetical protein